MYKDQRIQVRWNTCLSDISEISNGVKQGAELSPILFTDYIDQLLTRLRESGIGCHIEGVFAGAFVYVYLYICIYVYMYYVYLCMYIVMLVPFLDASRHMIGICED